MTEPAVPTLPRTCPAAVWLWPAQSLYAGPGLHLRPHSGSVPCLIVGVDGAIRVTVAGRDVLARSILVPPRTTHRVETFGGCVVSWHLDPTSGRARRCRELCRGSYGGLATDHTAEAALTRGPVDAADATRWLDVAAPAGGRALDVRIARVTAAMRADPGGVHSAAGLAADAGLSESRFLRLFERETGTSLRRHRSWVRMLAVGALVARGATLTEASADAGFASPSHFADRFRLTFGVSATGLLSGGAALHLVAG